MKIEANLTESTKVLKASIEAEDVKIIFDIDPNLATWEAWWHRNDLGQIIPEFEITANSEIPNPSALAHELLHARLDLDGFRVPLAVTCQLYGYPIQLSPEYLDGCYNNLEHHFMVTKFEDLGFEKRDFFQRPIELQLDEVRQTIEELYLLEVKNSPEFVAHYIDAIIHLQLLQSYFSECIDPSIDLKCLSTLEPELFEVINNTLANWLANNEPSGEKFFLPLHDKLCEYFRTAHPGVEISL
ncbi:MAG: hypothetical protein J7623_31415 [Chitinophaga sp.]|uniref:hypothetical protein n=1 Tax=Chitinophaga sp. TaxID=1869181 RepID=UPI001B0106A6|nr:hypothetical protein [Chitinophaga sp.]MBO9733193.1 hypothetical protein [Chitinophaga sp.]